MRDKRPLLMLFAIQRRASPRPRICAPSDLAFAWQGMVWASVWSRRGRPAALRASVRIPSPSFTHEHLARQKGRHQLAA